MYLTKHHGLGNDFLVSFADEVPIDAPERARFLCDRHIGVGADGLIFGVDIGTVPVMRLYNSDGSEAEISGNGLRCFLQALAMQRNVDRLDVEVDTRAGMRSCTLDPTEHPAVVHAATDMGSVSAGDAPDSDSFLDSVPGIGPIERWAIGAVGNPHLVVLVPDPSVVDLAIAGRAIEPHFPRGVNTHFVRVSGDDEIDLRPWERGAGMTQACGSGATVAAQRLHDWNLVGDRVTVHMPGGSATVDVAISSRSTAVLSGPATFVATVQVPNG